MRVLVTGESHSLPKALAVRGEGVEFIEVPVLEFEALPVDPVVKSRLFESPPDWIVFTSRRTVEFWKTAVGGLPSRSRLAAIGASTAAVLGDAVEFVPRRAGSEAFLEEFAKLHAPAGKRILIPGAEKSRPLLPKGLESLGARIEPLPLYRTSPKADVKPIPGNVAAVLFTSPSSVEALLAAGPLPNGVQVVSMGEYTSESLRAKGLKAFREVPEGDLKRIGEVL